MRLQRLFFLTLVCLLGLSAAAVAQKVVQQTFPTPEAAFEALLTAMKDDSMAAQIAILGPGCRPLIESGDPVADSEGRARLVRDAGDRTFFVKDGDARVIVNLGYDNWPMPIPLVREGQAWRFDTASGLQEVLNRRIGRNELQTIDALRAIMAAQRQYYQGDADGNGVLNYAGRIMSSSGKRDGLYWEAAPGKPQSPLGPLVAGAQQEGYSKSGSPFHGYYFKVLKGQGTHARGGRYSYVANGNMVGGYAVLAWPANYGNTGLTTFLVNDNGVIWEKDLGPDTDAKCRAMEAYDPDGSWRRLKTP